VDLALSDTTREYALGQDTLRYVQNRSSEGGISAFKLGFSRRIGPAVSLGVSLDILFGSLAQSDELLFLGNSGRVDLFDYMIAGGEGKLSQGAIFQGRKIINLPVKSHAIIQPSNEPRLIAARDSGPAHPQRTGLLQVLTKDHIVLCRLQQS